MVRSKDELLEDVKTIIGDSTDDNSLSFLENVSDTIDDLISKASDTEDWKSKYEENDKEWRKKYQERFYNTDTPNSQPDPTPEPEAPKPMSFDDLFTVKEN